MKTTSLAFLTASSMLASFMLAIFFASVTHAASATFDWATVGNPGNVGELSGVNAGGPGGFGPDAIVGAVADTYRISKTEVTNAQYTEFLNAVDPTAANSLSLFSSSMVGNFGGIESTGTTDGSRYIAQTGRENNPVTYISWYSSVRFINWLHNGQGTGDTEAGAYSLLGGTTTPTNGLSVTRDAGATYWLPSEDEWYKAAYYDPNKPGGAGYYDYATGIDFPTLPVSDQPGDDPGAVNYLHNDNIATNGFNDGYAVSGSASFGPNPFTDVGAYTSATSPYGTYDQSGNVWEWNETLVSSSARGLRGGGMESTLGLVAASGRFTLDPVDTFFSVGFRVATVPGLAGDFDNDSDIDGADFLEWQRDQNVGSLLDWEVNFGTTVPPVSALANVPEPSTSLMMALCCGIRVLRRPRRS